MSKSKFELKGFEELVKSLSELDKRVQNQISKEAIEEASIVMYERLKSEAPKAQKDSKSSYAFLDRQVIKKGDSHQAKMGITSSNWDMTRGLWFHYWGFRSHGRDLWIDRGFDSSIDKCQSIMAKKIEEGLSKW